MNEFTKEQLKDLHEAVSELCRIGYTFSSNKRGYELIDKLNALIAETE